MKSLLSLFASIADVATALRGIAATIRSYDARLVEALDHSPMAPQLPHGEVIDQPSNGTSRRTSKVKL